LAEFSAETAENRGTEFAHRHAQMNNDNSTNTDIPVKDAVGAPPQTDGQAAADDAAQIESDLDQLQAELNAARDRHLRLAAEFDNYRKRVARDQQENVVRAQANLLNRLVEVLDDLERVAHHSEKATLESLLHGVQLVERKLRQSLESAGLERIAAEDTPFDPSTMEALMTVPTDNPEEDDHVADVFQHGYRYQGVLLRPARVRVKKHEA
jgi:molecular chaperone GrpE